MKLERQDRTIRMSGDFKQTKAKIICNDAMFTLLADKLYRNKIRAAIRELCCNAADSHTESGNTGPFLVTMPNGLEPYFKVTDEGLGLAEDDVLNLYQNFGASTRAGTDNVTGGFGLGSKAPYAYTQTFNVVSWFNGEKKTYICFRNEDGVPSTTLTASETTEASNGLEVSFRVEAKDNAEYYKEDAHVLKAFTQEYKVEGYELSLPGEKVSHSGEGWTVIEHQADKWGYRDRASTSIVRMGNVDYPVPVESLDDLDSASQLLWTELGVILSAKVGTLSPTPSREDLEINETMKTYIGEKLDCIRKSLMSEFVESVNNCGSLWEARLVLRKLKADSTFSLLTDGGKVGVPQWKGQIVEDQIWMRDLQARVVTYTRSEKYHQGENRPSVTTADTHRYKPYGSDVLVIDNLTGTDFKLKNFVRHELKLKERLVLITATTKKSLKGVLNLLGKGQRELKLASEVDLSEATKAELKAIRAANRVPRADGTTAAARRKRGTVKGYKLNTDCSAYTDLENFWTEIDGGVPYKGKRGVYIVIHRWESLPWHGHEGSVMKPSTLRSAVEVLQKYCWEDFELIAVKKADAKKLEAEPGWVTVDTLVPDTYDLLCNSQEYHAARKVNSSSLHWNLAERSKHPFWEQIQSYNHKGSLREMILLAQSAELATTSTFASLLSAVDNEVTSKEVEEEVTTLGSLIHYSDRKSYGLRGNDGKPWTDRIAKDPYTPLAAICDKYPMVLLTHDMTKHRSKLCDYINLIDSLETQ